MNSTTYSMLLHIGRVEYNRRKGEDKGSGTINEYQLLFQQMINAKKSLTVETTDQDGIRRKMVFNVTGLREGLIEFNQRCGTYFQYYSGIKAEH